MFPASEITPFWFERCAIFLPSNVTFRSFLSLSISSSGVDIHPEDYRERVFHLSEKLRVGTEGAGASLEREGEEQLWVKLASLGKRGALNSLQGGQG